MEGWNLLYTTSRGVRIMAGIYSPMCRDRASVRSQPASAYILAE
jgi:hypothetical protein